MSEIPPIQSAIHSSSQPPVSAGQAIGAARTAPVLDADDQIEISEVGQLLSVLDPPDDIRLDKVLAIRQAIADGTYLTDDKIAATVDRLLAVLSLPRAE